MLILGWLLGYEIGLASEKRLRRMEHKLKESEKMVSFLKTLVFQLPKQPNFGI
jgi:hypothetical protein